MDESCVSCRDVGGGLCSECGGGEQDDGTTCANCGGVGLCPTCVGSLAWLRAAIRQLRCVRRECLDTIRASMTPNEFRRREEVLETLRGYFARQNESHPLQGDEGFHRIFAQGAILGSSPYGTPRNRRGDVLSVGPAVIPFAPLR